jgi:hypothetical protein
LADLGQQARGSSPATDVLEELVEELLGAALELAIVEAVLHGHERAAELGLELANSLRMAASRLRSSLDARSRGSARRRPGAISRPAHGCGRAVEVHAPGGDRVLGSTPWWTHSFE